MARKTLAERFERFVYTEPNTGCWLWGGSCKAGGYGHFGVSHGKIVAAHRVSYGLHIGPIPECMVVCHRCDTPACVNPHHLFLGTPGDNSADRDAKGRLAYGERNGRAKLTTPEAVEAHKLIDAGLSERAIARRFNVSRGAIRAIKNGVTWKTHRLAA